MIAKKAVEKVAEKAVEKKKQKLRKKVKKILRLSLLGVCLLGTGYFLGVHHRVIAAMVMGKEAPKGHWLHKA